MPDFSLDVRDGILLALALAGAYVLILVLRLLRVRTRNQAGSDSPSSPSHSGAEPVLQAPAAKAPEGGGKKNKPLSPLSPLAAVQARSPALVEPATPRENSKPETADDGLDPVPEPLRPGLLDGLFHRRRSTPPVPALGGKTETSAAEPAAPSFSPAILARQVALESQVVSLEAEVLGLRQLLDDMQQELTRLSAAQHVSPLYNEAVRFAHLGLGADAIATRCGISVAEAELVVALANKSSARFDDDLADGESPGAELGRS